jgi:protein arginine N-methyltransferase 1
MRHRADYHPGYGPEEVWFAASLYVDSWEEDFHQLMLDDHLRMDAYQSAIAAAVRPGMSVLDLGTGTGILAHWALQAGARVVHGIEVSDVIIPWALERLAWAGERFRLHRGLSFQIELPERVDLIVSEILGNRADNEGMSGILADARARFLAPGGQMLPARARAYLTPVAAVRAHAQVATRRCRGLSGRYRLDELLERLGVRTPFDLAYDVIIPDKSLLAAPAIVNEFLFEFRDEAEYQREIIFTVSNAGPFTGFKGHFVAELTSGVILDISGDDIAAGRTSDSWKHSYLPIARPIQVERGDRIEVTYRRSAAAEAPFRQDYSWRGRVRRGDRLLGEFKGGIDP